MPSQTRAAAFTLIEIMIVVTIIGVLASMIVVGVGIAQFKAKVAKTTQRMEQIQTAIGGLGRELGSSAFRLQRDVGLGGTAVFDLNPNTNVAQPKGPNLTTPGPWHQCYPRPGGSGPGNPVTMSAAPGNPLVMTYPWGKNRLFFVREDWYQGPLPNGLGLPTTNPDDASMTAAARETWYKTWRTPEQHVLSELWPRKTLQLLRIAGILTGATEAEAVANFNLRTPSLPWNDAWGHPLVLAYGLFQPTECNLRNAAGNPDPRYPKDYYLKQALSQYQYNRSVYLTMAAVGPLVDTTLMPGGLPDSSSWTTFSDWDDTCAAIFEQACKVCMIDPPGLPDPDPKYVWTELGFDAPPWTGAKLGDLKEGGRRLRSLLMAPIEIK